MTQTPTQKPITEAAGWSWENQGDIPFSCRRTTKKWTQALREKRDLVEELNRRWSVVNSPRQWKHRWKVIWNTRCFERVRFWIWRLVHRGFFTGCREFKMGVASRTCEGCDEDLETLENLWWSCRKVYTRKWQVLSMVSEGEDKAAPDHLLGFIDYTLITKKCRNGKVKVLSAYLEREKQYDLQREVDQMPIRGILKIACDELEAESILSGSLPTTTISQGQTRRARNDFLQRPEEDRETCRVSMDGDEQRDETRDGARERTRAGQAIQTSQPESREVEGRLGPTGHVSPWTDPRGNVVELWIRSLNIQVE
ncbi:hypothetical protein R1sor_020790 [Riccia sorocarpa]|uniref:Reverse transcriptase zinc-binding domain-containing protein n=1 Tax=Riccia sorocarpa TaxID=122646 RepID=A0ABD3GHA6_9MARC